MPYRSEGTSEVSFADQVEVTDVGPCHLLLMPTTAQEVVSWYGSIRANPDFEKEDELIQEIVVGLLDKGTKHRDRFEVAEILDNRGAELDFSNEGLTVEFDGRALSSHVPDVLRILAEQLREPLLDPTEFKKTKAQVGASLRRSLERTGSQASGLLSRRLYQPAHPNYTPPTEEALRLLESLTIDDVLQYHETHFGSNELTLVLVGDLDVEATRRAVEKAFDGWQPHDMPQRFASRADSSDPGKGELVMPGKPNIDVRMGHALPLKRQHQDYIPLFLANYVLGGNFSARLMTSIRDEMGLTYGIGSSFKGITTEVEGHWQIAVTLSQENLDLGVDATLEEVRRFVEEGITAEELDDVKQTVTGSFKVGLATTRGLANVLHLNELRGFGPEYLDHFPDEVNAVNVQVANEAIRKYFNVDLLHVAMAGAVPEETNVPSTT